MKKKCMEISSFYTSVPKVMIICYTVPEKWHMTGVIFNFHFGLFLALFSPKNQNFKKIKHLEISFYTCVPKAMVR